MLNFRLIELESELLAKQQSLKSYEELLPSCLGLLEYLEQEVGVRLADPVPRNWVGWLTYRQHKNSLIVLRGKAFHEGSVGKHRAGLDVPGGGDAITEYQRGFDVSPPQDLDHLLVNFSSDADPRVFLWYGENIAPYKLIYFANVSDDPHKELSEAVVEACVWTTKRPKGMTFGEFFQDLV